MLTEVDVRYRVRVRAPSRKYSVLVYLNTRMYYDLPTRTYRSYEILNATSTRRTSSEVKSYATFIQNARYDGHRGEAFSISNSS